ncbi:MAG: hypothetical protein ACRDUT_00130 [Mycobacterium sp.]
MSSERKPAVLPEGHARLSLSDIVWLLLHREARPLSSVKLSRNAKGDVQPEVSIYHGDLPDGADVFEAERVCVDIFDRLSAKYPTAEGTVRRTS